MISCKSVKEFSSIIQLENGKLYFKEACPDRFDRPDLTANGDYYSTIDKKYYPVKAKFILSNEANVSKMKEKIREISINLRLMKDPDNKYILYPLDVGAYQISTAKNKTQAYFVLALPKYENDLKTLIANKEIKKDSKVLLSIMSQMVKAVQYSHRHSGSKKTLYIRDIKPQNFVGKKIKETDNWEIRMIDLGSAKEYSREEEDHTFGVGTIIYMPPEQLTGYWQNIKDKTKKIKIDGKKVDSWCLGLSIFQLLTESKFYDLKAFQKFSEKKDDKLYPPLLNKSIQVFLTFIQNFIQQNKYPYVDTDLKSQKLTNKIIRQLLLATINQNPDTRKTVQELKYNTSFCPKLFEGEPPTAGPYQYEGNQKEKCIKRIERLEKDQEEIQRQRREFRLNENDGKEIGNGKWMAQDNNMTYEQYRQIVGRCFRQ